MIGTRRAGRSLQVVALLAFFSLGLPDGVLGVVWPSMRRTFALPMGQLGILLTAAMVGYLASSVASGVLVARLGLGRVLVASSAATAASAVVYALASHWAMVVAASVQAGGHPRRRPGSKRRSRPDGAPARTGIRNAPPRV